MKKLFTTLLLSLSFNALADLPLIDAPRELIQGEFAEGTVTQLTEAEVAEFLPWAQNAHNQLTRAITMSRSVPLRDRRPLLERAIRSVVLRSGSRQYQMFMRFSLNRGLLLVSEMEKHMNMEEIGAQENAVDLLLRSIQASLSFYESDLNFQRRAQSGNMSTVLRHAHFAVTYMQSMYPGVINVLNAKAQYRLLYKLIEMVNWDLSRDADAPKYADEIVEAHELLQLLPELPADDDRTNLRHVRRLNSVRVIQVRNVSTDVRVVTPETEVVVDVPTERVTGPTISVGSVVLETFEGWSVQRVKAIAGDGLIALEDGVWYHRDRLKRLVSSYNGISLDESVVETFESFSEQSVRYISEDGKFLFNNHREWHDSQYVQKLEPSFRNFSVGQQVVETYSGRRKILTIQKITKNGKFLLSDDIWYDVSYIVKLN